MNTRAVGNRFEADAVCYLEEHGYRILERNYRCRFGEIDIVALYQGYLVFVEVKYRQSSRKGDPWESVDVRKQRRISRVAVWYMMKNNIREDTPCRFDVVGITPTGIKLYQNAFDYVK